MEIINKLDEQDIGASLLRLNRDIKKIQVYASKINDMKDDLDAKLDYMKNIQKQLYVYKYIVINLLNLAQKWCVDNGSPVYFFVMNNARDTCSHCNAGQGSEANCGEGYYNEAFDTMKHVDYGFCDGCQSIYSTGDIATCFSCDSGCNSYNSCQHCNSCQGCESGQSGCSSCNSCQGCEIGQSCNICQGCESGQGGCSSCNAGCQGCNACQSGYSTGGAACSSGYIVTYCNTCYSGCQGCQGHQDFSCLSSYVQSTNACSSSYGFSKE